jgi:hypothetical protein
MQSTEQPRIDPHDPQHAVLHEAVDWTPALVIKALVDVTEETEPADWHHCRPLHGRSESAAASR